MKYSTIRSFGCYRKPERGPFYIHKRILSGIVITAAVAGIIVFGYRLLANSVQGNLKKENPWEFSLITSIAVTHDYAFVADAGNHVILKFDKSGNFSAASEIRTRRAVAYFALPLVFAMFFGRIFYAGVCPIGAIQDIFILWPVRVPEWLERTLGMLPYIHLSLAVLFAATNADFTMCRFHPFLKFFRFAAGFNLLIFGVSFLVAGMFVARPYCRYLCPQCSAFKMDVPFLQMASDHHA